MNIKIRNEDKKDYHIVENIHREAFWNLNVPGCNEHYLAHVIRKHPDFVDELDYVCEIDGEVVGNIMYTKSQLIDDDNRVSNILTFGPIGVLPEYQRKGIGKLLLNHSFKRAVELNYPAIVIFGNPSNYVTSGFKSSFKYNVCLSNGIFPMAMLAKELKTGFFDGKRYCFKESEAYNFNENDITQFDMLFPKKEKAYQDSQEEFYINSHSIINNK